MNNPSTSLAHVLIAKSIIETVLVGALALVTFFNVFPPYFHGWGELIENGIAGWAVNNAQPWERVEVQLYVDGQFVASALANQSRPDVMKAGWSKDEWHGYFFPMDGFARGQHEARVYALHTSGNGGRKSLQLLGEAISFLADEQGKLRTLPK